MQFEPVSADNQIEILVSSGLTQSELDVEGDRLVEII
jgi:hypothetical protein